MFTQADLADLDERARSVEQRDATAWDSSVADHDRCRRDALGLANSCCGHDPGPASAPHAVKGQAGLLDPHAKRDRLATDGQDARAKSSHQVDGPGCRRLKRSNRFLDRSDPVGETPKDLRASGAERKRRTILPEGERSLTQTRVLRACRPSGCCSTREGTRQLGRASISPSRTSWVSQLAG